MTPQPRKRKFDKVIANCRNGKCMNEDCENNPCYYHSEEVQSMLSDIHDFMLIKKEQNGSRDTVLIEHRKELNGIHTDIKSLNVKVGLATVMGAITLAVLGAFLTITTYIILKSL